ncbi:hypothetical protein B0H19DRAFT_1271340 [Mycena capillaripes]|nr:hypothetical protein B0H19DRAFT_1271340 [Mycena capillaripes]
MLGFILLAHLANVNAWIWPSPQLDSRARPCDLFVFDEPNSGRSDAADWIRTAYHDMATHNVVDGTGGMDASIRFDEEQIRTENSGDGFGNTVSFLLGESTRYVSSISAIATLKL